MKFKKSQLKRIIAEELSKSNAMKNILSERAKFKPGQKVEKIKSGGKTKHIVRGAEVYGTEPEHYANPANIGQPVVTDVEGDMYQGEFVPKLRNIGNLPMFDRGDLTDRQINAMMRKNSNQDILELPQGRSQTSKRARLNSALEDLLEAQSLAEQAGEEAISQKIDDAISMLNSLGLKF